MTIKRKVTAVAWIVLAGLSIAQEGRQKVMEEFVMGDPDKAIASVMPDTEQWFFLRCLRLQKAGQLEKADEALFQWAVAAGYENYHPISPKYATQRIPERPSGSGFHRDLFDRMALRQTFLYYDKDSGRTLKYLSDEVFALDFSDREADFERAGVVHPSVLDPKTILEREFRSVSRQKLSRWVTEQLVYEDDLDADDKQSLMKSAHRPDVPGLMEWLLADLGKKERSFGDFEVHKKLTLAQLKTCLQRHPKVAENGVFVKTYVQRLMPLDIEGEAGRTRYLKDLLSFTKTLPKSMVSLRVTALFNVLSDNAAREAVDAAMFEEYLKLTAPVPEIEREEMAKKPTKPLPEPSELGLSPVTDASHDRVIDVHMRAMVKDDAGVARLKPFVEENRLKVLVATTRLLHGIGEPTTHVKSLGANRAKKLRSRVDLELPPTNPKSFGANDDVALTVEVKNVKSLLINVYALNLKNYLITMGRYPGVGLNVDGIQPTYSSRKDVAVDPMRSKRHVIPFPELKKPGAYLVELVGGDKSCRVLIVKGRLFVKAETTPAGQKLNVFDETGAKRTTATVQIGTRVFESDKNGDVMVPFASGDDDRRVVLSSGGVHSLGNFWHKRETYSLKAAFFTPRESLLAGRMARVIVRPQLTVTGVPLPLSMLKEASLGVEYRYSGGVWKRGPHLEKLTLKTRRELMVDVPVPEHATGVRFELRGMLARIDKEVQHLSVHSDTVTFNDLNATNRLRQSFVKATPKGYELHLLGRNGELFPGLKVQMKLYHWKYKLPVTRWLQTDADGVVRLGPLKGIIRVEYAYAGHTEAFQLIDREPETMSTWHASSSVGVDYPTDLTIRKGEVVSLPYDGELKPGSVSLMQAASVGYLRDCSDHLSVEDGALQVKGLDAGIYSLRFFNPQRWVGITVLDGKAVGDFVVLGDKVYETMNPSFMRLSKIEESDKDLIVQTVDAGKGTRVHVVATRFLPTQPLGGHFRGYPQPSPRVLSRAMVGVEFSRTLVLDPEYLYVLNRQNAIPLPGNMLPRPGILLNPFDRDDIRDTHSPLTFTGPMGGRGGGGRAVGKYGGSARGQSRQWGIVNPCTMDWLEAPATIIANRVPDAKGVVRISKALFGDCHHLTVLAMDEVSTINRTHLLQPKPIAKRDLRLKRMIPPGTRKRWKSAAFVTRKGDDLKIPKGPKNQVRVIDSLTELYDYGQRATNGSWRLQRFWFLVKWPELKEEDKRQFYSDFVSHELNFFLYKKDRPFFDKVVKPYLINKRDKTFMDHWLLEENLTSYTDLTRFSVELNTMEKVLLAERIPAMRQIVGNCLRRELRNAIPIEVELIQEEFDTGLDAGGKAAEVFDEFELEEPAEEKAIESIEKNREKMRTQGFYALSPPIRVYVETHYYKRLLNELNNSFIPPSTFWKDYLSRDRKKPFVPVSIHAARHNSAEWLMAMALVDLPFKSKTKITDENGTIVRRFAGNAIVYRRSFEDVKLASKASSIFLKQNYYDVGKRGEQSGNASAPHYVTSFEPGRLYGCQLVLSNPTQSPTSVEIMAQIPIGSIPISGGNQAPTTTAVRRFDLDAYATKHLHYRFYFPSVGTFSSYPAQALREDHIVASCPQAPIVVAVPVEPVKTNDWRDLAKNGSVKEILDYLDTHDPSRLDLRVLSARLKEKPFYETMVGWFRSHALPENTIFKFGFVHNDVAAIKDFLRWNRVGGLDLGFELTSPLLSVRRHSDRTFEHVELDPVINPRAHLVSGKRVLGGDQVLDFYRAALNSLSYRRALDDEDRLELAYHLFLQDRVGEALNLFAKVDRDKLVTKLQYDYFKAYALFYEGKVAGAEAIAKKHATHPVEHWRKRFETVLAHAAETRMVVGGDEAPEAKPGEKGPVAAEILHREPMLDATMVGDAVQITHANMESCTMGIYVMNLEFLFSKNPFIDRDHGHFLHMRPNHSMPVSLDKSGKTRVEIPKDYRNKHLLIELSGAGKRVVQTHVASGLVAYVEQNHGEVKVVDTAGKPVSAAYVKVYFSGTDGGAAFYKDGYTDLRGRFNYAALNSSKAGDNPITRVSRFAILVTAPNKGSLVKEVRPPTGVDSEEDPFGEDLDGGLDDGGLDDGGLNDDAW